MTAKGTEPYSGKHGKSSRTTRRAPLMERYVTIGSHFGKPHQVKLRIGNQSFNINDPCEDREQAEWMRDMVCNALDRLVKYEQFDGGFNGRPGTAPGNG